MAGDWIDLDAFLPTIKDAARDQRPIAWVAWVLGALAVALGALPPPHWYLLSVGVLLILAAAVHLVRVVLDRRDSRRIARRPPVAPAARTENQPPEVRLRIDVAGRDEPPPA